MKAFKVELIVVDHEDHGKAELINNLQHMKYYYPDIIDIVEGDIGEWHDDHPLNQRNTSYSELVSYFKK